MRRVNSDVCRGNVESIIHIYCLIRLARLANVLGRSVVTESCSHSFSTFPAPELIVCVEHDTHERNYLTLVICIRQAGSEGKN